MGYNYIIFVLDNLCDISLCSGSIIWSHFHPFTDHYFNLYGHSHIHTKPNGNLYSHTKPNSNFDAYSNFVSNTRGEPFL